MSHLHRNPRNGNVYLEERTTIRVNGKNKTIFIRWIGREDKLQSVKPPQIGRQRFCPRCKEFWPADSEFFFSDGNGGFHSWCKACVLENKRINYYNYQPKGRTKQLARSSGGS